MKNPLIKRLPRELIGEFPKYIVIFLFMTLTIGFISGFLVAGNSMIIAYDESFEKYNIEDGHVEFEEEADDTMMDEVEKEENVTFYKDFYKEAASILKKDNSQGTMRVFQPRETVNKICLMEGTMPKKKNQVAIDRMHADNNNWKIGDKITLDGKEYDICGLVALSDYSALYSDNNDFMFDAVKFGVAVMSKEGYETLSEDKEHFQYDWVYADKSQTEKEKNDKAEDFMTAIAKKAYNKNLTIKNFIPEYANQAIHFTGEDMGGDRAMMIGLLYILIAIIAFIFSITIKHTIIRESSVIGTLRASGYTRGEVLRHYLAVPIMVTLISSLLGNVLGYTVFKDMVADLYYGSYSLPTYVTVWNAEAFVMTTVIPIVLMLVVNAVTLIKKLRLSPLKFIRRDLSTKKKKKALRLPHFKFFTRFRIRIVLQNLSSYLMMFIGIFFASVLLLFGMMMQPLLEKYQDKVLDAMIAPYQYVLKTQVDTTNPDAEKYSMISLNYEGKTRNEDISIYGLVENGKYFTQELPKEGVAVSDSFNEKYGVQVGDTITLKEKYEGKQYRVKIAKVIPYAAGIAVFMPIDQFNETFEMKVDLFDQGFRDPALLLKRLSTPGKPEYFTGYFSKEKLTDIDEKYISSCITEDDMTKLSRQLNVSMGGMFEMIKWFAVALAVLIIYLLTKLILERNTTAISMVKILGYENGEIGRLYLITTTWFVLFSIIISLFLSSVTMLEIYQALMINYNGWISIYYSPEVYPIMVFMVLGAYALVALVQFRKIKKIPMDEALKNVE